MKQKVRVSLIQSSPVLFNRAETIKKVESLALQAAKENTDLILFPEAFIPAYPRGLTFGTKIGSRSEQGRAAWAKYTENSVAVPSPSTDLLAKIAEKAGSYLVIGVVEKGKTGTLYCSLLYFDSGGKLVGKHRKLKPTAAERIIWGEGDGTDLDVYDTDLGKIGGLICWENYMPLARMALFRQGIEIYLAPTADMRDSWQASMRHIATEGRCFVLSCNQFVTKGEYPQLPGEDFSVLPDVVCRGGSVVVDPLGNVIAGPAFDHETILTATLDMNLITRAKMDFDAAGHYARDDVFNFSINKKRITKD